MWHHINIKTFTRIYSLHLQANENAVLIFDPEDGCSMFIRNISKVLWCAPKRQHPSSQYLLLCGPRNLDTVHGYGIS
jgi:hypothetical protein